MLYKRHSGGAAGKQPLGLMVATEPHISPFSHLAACSPGSAKTRPILTLTCSHPGSSEPRSIPAPGECLPLKFDYRFLILVQFFMLMALLADNELPRCKLNTIELLIRLLEERVGGKLQVVRPERAVPLPLGQNATPHGPAHRENRHLQLPGGGGARERLQSLASDSTQRRAHLA